MTQWKRTATLIAAAVAAVALLVVGIVLSWTNHNASEKDNEMSLKRLDEISQRLSTIWLELENIDGQLSQLEYEKDNLISEQTKLNDEAAAIFMSMMTPEMFEPQEEKIPVCDYLIQQELDNIKAWVQDEVWFYHLIANAWCEYDWELPQTEWQPGQLTEDWTNQVMPEVNWNSSHERFKEIAYAYWLDPSKIREVENHYWLTEWIVLCITIAETSWGKFWAGQWNIWNVWNNDRGDRVSFALADTGLEKIWQTLTNQYLWGHHTLWCLSNWHHCEEVTDNGKRYATSSPETSWAWEPNMVACLSQIYGEDINPATFNIRNR